MRWDSNFWVGSNAQSTLQLFHEQSSQHTLSQSFYHLLSPGLATISGQKNEFKYVQRWPLYPVAHEGTKSSSLPVLRKQWANSGACSSKPGFPPSFPLHITHPRCISFMTIVVSKKNTRGAGKKHKQHHKTYPENTRKEHQRRQHLPSLHGPLKRHFVSSPRRSHRLKFEVSQPRMGHPWLETACYCEWNFLAGKIIHTWIFNCHVRLPEGRTNQPITRCKMILQFDRSANYVTICTIGATSNTNR